METIINYFYNLFPDNIKSRFGGFLFNVYDERYLLVEVLNDGQMVLDIYNLLIENKVGNFIAINNKDNVLISKKDDKSYILFRIRCNADDLLEKNETISIVSKGNANWSKLWSERIDYYEIQVNELGQDKIIILNSIYYYIGLAENAIAIASKYESAIDSLSLQHYRMNVPVLKGDYFNPCNMILDIQVRDIAEYIKSSFFNDTIEISEYITYLMSLPLDNVVANLLFARLLYPTYYFDLFDEIIFNEREEKELISVIDQHYNYEKFLKVLYTSLSTKYQLDYIEWLKKEAFTAPH